MTYASGICFYDMWMQITGEETCWVWLEQITVLPPLSSYVKILIGPNQPLERNVDMVHI